MPVTAASEEVPIRFFRTAIPGYEGPLRRRPCVLLDRKCSGQHGHQKPGSNVGCLYPKWNDDAPSLQDLTRLEHSCRSYSVKRSVTAMRSHSSCKLMFLVLICLTLMGTSNAQDTQLSLIHISEPTRLGMISYAVFC